eukprot:gene1945-17483_t
MTGIYASRTRVIPNSAGVFTISLLNVSAEDMILTARKPVGTLHAAATGSITQGPVKDNPSFDCVFGREPTLPQDLILGSKTPQATDIATASDYATETKQVNMFRSGVSIAVIVGLWTSGRTQGRTVEATLAENDVIKYATVKSFLRLKLETTKKYMDKVKDREPRTLKGLMNDYNKLLDNFNYPECERTLYIKKILEDNFGDELGFHNRFQKNESTIVYDSQSGGTYIEVTINSWGIDKEHSMNSVAHHLRDTFKNQPIQEWPPHSDRLTEEKQPQEELRCFRTWLRSPSTKDFPDDCEDPISTAFSDILLAYVTRQRSLFQQHKDLQSLESGLLASPSLVEDFFKYIQRRETKRHSLCKPNESECDGKLSNGGSGHVGTEGSIRSHKNHPLSLDRGATSSFQREKYSTQSSQSKVSGCAHP